MQPKDLLPAVRNDRVQFVTTRPLKSTSATLEREVKVTGPPELVELSQLGDLGVLDELVSLLKDPDRAWAAAVLLSAMTGEEAKTVDSFATNPDGWWKSLGGSAHQRWATWLEEKEEELTWDAASQMFVERG